MQDLNLEKLLNNNEIMNNDNNNNLISLLAVKELLNNKNLKQNSRLKLEQIPLIVKLLLFSNTFNTKLTKDMANLIMELQISTNGLGRRELVELAKNNSDIVIERKKGIFR